MEELGDGYGYALYCVDVEGFNRVEKIKLTECSDRAHLYLNNHLVATFYGDSFYDDFELYLPAGKNTLTILVENMGRVNYGAKLYAPSQRKGMRCPLMVDLHFEWNYKQYALNFTAITHLDYTKPLGNKEAAFYQFNLTINDKPQATFVDCRNYGKGIILVNGFNIGRYWSLGPITYLYIPASLFTTGLNSIVIFETEAVPINQLILTNRPHYINKY
jgi:beta-galactosidase